MCIRDSIIFVSGDTDGDGVLDVGEIWIFMGTYAVTQMDVDLGVVFNQAIVTGDDPNGDEVIDISDDDNELEDDVTETELPNGDPSISLLKSGVFQDLNGNEFADAGEIIAYTFTVTNTGNVTLTNITIDDPLIDVEGGPIDLAPGESDDSTFTGVYLLTEEDIENGFVLNQATVTAFDSEGENPITDLSDTATDPDGDVIEDPESVESISGITADIPNGDPTDDPTVVIFEGVLPATDIIIYNGISTNGDGTNDSFIIENIEDFPDNRVQIFNRWGIEVYDREGYLNDDGNEFRGFSDGRVTVQRGDRLPVGTYYYIVNYVDNDGQNQSVAGYLYIND